MAARRAFIIGSSSSKHGALQGVAADHTNYSAYLCSNAGGAWSGNEITHVSSPSESELSSLLNVKADFTLLVYAGHGYCQISGGETRVCLNDDEDVSVEA